MLLFKKRLLPSSTRPHQSAAKRLRPLRCELLEARQMLSLSGCPELNGLSLVDLEPGQLNGQTVYLDFDGAEGVTYDGPVVVENLSVSAFDFPTSDTTSPDQQQELVDQLIAEIVTELQVTFADLGVIFTTKQPVEQIEYSTIYIGGDNSAFAQYGSFLGLAEKIDIGNADRSDEAIVFAQSWAEYGDANLSLTELIAHEAGHLFGYEHCENQLRTCHTESVLSDVAYETRTHVVITNEGGDLYNALFGVPGVSLELDAYISGTWTDSANTGNSIEEGSWDEDDGIRALDHFCEGGDGDELLDAPWWAGTGLNTLYENADGEKYPNAISAYNSGDKGTAYWWLGRTMHLLQDSTTPAHIHNDPHTGLFDGDDEYEINAHDYRSYFTFDSVANGTSWNFQDWNGYWSNAESLWARSDDYTSIRSLFQETTDYADDYDSDDYPGDYHDSSEPTFPLTRLAELDRDFHSTWASNHVTGDGSELNSTEVQYLAHDLGTWAVEQSAMLIRYFYNDLGEVLPSPTDIGITDASSNDIDLAWDSVTSADGYALYRSTSPDSDFSWIASTSNSSYTDESLTADTSYYYRVYAYSEIAGLGSGYTSVMAATDPVMPGLAGDANLDGRVDGSDVTILAANWQAGVPDGDPANVTWSMGDFNFDGRVDGSDVTILAGNWQAGVNSTVVTVSSPNGRPQQPIHPAHKRLLRCGNRPSSRVNP